LSIHAGEEIGYHFELGERLAALRERGVFILGSGNVVHNLRRIDWSHPDGAYDWGLRFDAEVKRMMTSAPKDILAISAHPDYALAVPTPEHFLPLPYLAGLCHRAGEPAEVLIEGGTMGSLTMTSYLLGCRGLPHPLPGHGPAAALPDSIIVPPESSNA
jgi:4,5-DOPA dioxygenase extradiol